MSFIERDDMEEKHGVGGLLRPRITRFINELIRREWQPGVCLVIVLDERLDTKLFDVLVRGLGKAGWVLTEDRIGEFDCLAIVSDLELGAERCFGFQFTTTGSPVVIHPAKSDDLKVA